MKDFFKFLGKTLFNNQAVINGKNRKFYQSLIVVLLSLIFAILPVFSLTMSMNGSSVITKTDNSSLDVSLNLFSKYLSENSDTVAFKTTEDGEFYVEGFTEKEFYVGEKHLLSIKVLSDNDNLTEISKFYTEGTTDGKPTVNPKSFMLIGKTELYIYTFANGAKNVLNEDGSIKSTASYTTTYLGYASSFKNQNFADFYHNELNGSSLCVEEWSHALNKMYKPYKQSTVLYTCSVYSALNLVIIVTMSLITMIMTKIRKNQCEPLTFVQSLNCMNWASLSPAIISMILGFLFSSLASIMFIICIGVRSVALSSKASSNLTNKY